MLALKEAIVGRIGDKSSKPELQWFLDSGSGLGTGKRGFGFRKLMSWVWKGFKRIRGILGLVVQDSGVMVLRLA